MTVEDVLEAIIDREKGFVDDMSDHGGATKYGITAATLETWRQKPVSTDDVRALGVDEAKAILRSWYVEPFQGIVSGPLLGLMADCAVNHGATRAARWLQRAVGALEDGNLGPASIAAIQAHDQGKLYLRVCATRVRAYGKIVTADHSQARFADGWADRVAGFIEAAA